MARWTVDDALRVTARFAEWLATGDANRLAQNHVWCFIDHPDENDGLRELAGRSNAALAQEIRAQSPIWCDPGMVDLLAAATAVLPEVEPVEEDHLPHPRAGMVLFSKPLPTDWSGAMDEDGQWREFHDEISVITWERPFTNRGVIRSWCRGAGVFNVTGGTGRIRCPDLRPSPVIELLGEDHPATPVSKILIALTALTRTSGVVGQSDEPTSKAARQVARKAGLIDSRVRRLYLQKADSGAYELEALRAQRHGTPRGHWVRGHWRHTWFPSVEEHRWQWVEGFLRGDFTKGAVSGERIQVARKQD